MATPVHMPRAIGSVFHFFFYHSTINFSGPTSVLNTRHHLQIESAFSDTNEQKLIEETNDCVCVCFCVCDQASIHQVMKALTSSCSKPIVERLISSSPRSDSYVSDRPEFSFSRNDKKGCNFRFLTLVQNKGNYPVHAVPSKTQVDLEIVEPLAQQTNEPKIVHVKFQLQKNCKFGEQFLIVGDDPMFGSWDPSKALPMTWSDGHIWTVKLDIPSGKSIQFKFILKGKGDIIWQPGSDRIIRTWETMTRITVCEDWENAQLQKIIEEDQLAHSNEEPHIDSEVSTSAENLGHPKEELVSNVAKVLGIEDSQTLAEEKPFAEPDLKQIIADNISSSMKKPMAIVAENIGSSEDLIKTTSRRKTKRNMIHRNENSANSPRNDAKIHGLRHNGKAAPVKNQEERTFGKGNLFDFEGSPILVPGLTPSVVPTEEAGAGEVEERITVDTSIGAFETKDQIQNMPEFNKEQESDGGTPQEINAALSNEPELHDNEYDEKSLLATAMGEISNCQPVDSNVLHNEVQWGRETLNKFLTKLGLLAVNFTEPLEETSLKLIISCVIFLIHLPKILLAWQRWTGLRDIS